MVITRFAPSPTGYLHIGGARTALFNWLFAKSNGGLFLLRIEDTDKARSEMKYVENILDSLEWLGINPDKEVIYQSDREDRYKEIIDKLLEKNLAYYCNCTKKELDFLRQEQQEKGIKPKYDGRNRDKNLDNEPGSVVRFKTPLDGKICIKDTLKGEVTVNNEELDDLIIQRADGSPTYNLTVVVDDIDMMVTNVIRGDDHVNNTFRQAHIIDALGIDRPIYTHIPLILGEDRKRLSKRHGATSTYDFRKEGFLPLAMINYLARLGWASGDKEKFTIEIISPDRSIIKTETSEVVIPSFEGEMGILKDHIPLITFLRPGLINIKTNTDQKFFVEEGTVEFSNNNLLILTSTAKEVTKMNKKFIDTLISESEKKLDNNEITDKERYLLSYKLETLRNINQ